MRGKNILWIPFVAMLVCAIMMDTGVAQDSSRIYVDPPLISNKDLSMKLFTVSIKVENVEDLYTYAFELHFAKYVSTLAVVRVVEGDFFKGHPGYSPGEFNVKILAFEGIVKVASTLLFYDYGVSGDGTLALIQFQVLEAGVSPLRLENVALYNSDRSSIRDEIEHGYYEGPVVNLIRCKLGPRKRHPGETQTFNVTVKNEGDIPLKAKAKIENMRIEDGKLFTFWAGLAYSTAPPPPPVYLYVDGFTADAEEWITVGTEPWLDASEDGNYIEAPIGFDGAWMVWFTFEDVVLPVGYGIGRVTLEGYTDGPYEEGVDFDVYTQNWAWLGSLYAAGEPAWVGVRWTGASVNEADPSAGTLEGLNALKVLVMLYDPDLICVPGNIVDCLRLKVEFGPLPTPIYVVPPGEEMDFDLSEWTLREEDVAKYACTITVYTTYNDFAWNPAPKVQTRSWEVRP